MTPSTWYYEYGQVPGGNPDKSKKGVILRIIGFSGEIAGDRGLKHAGR